MPAELVYSCDGPPLVTIVIPSLDGDRGGNVERLIAQLKAQTVLSIEIIISRNEKPNGHARNVGIEIASLRSQFYAFFDDDVQLGSAVILENFLSVLQDSQIGLVGASQLPPEDSTWTQLWIGYDLAKAKFSIQKKIIDTEMATHAGMACRRTVWEEMKGESDVLVTGTDTDLRDRMRNYGYRVVVAPNTWVFHPLPKSILKVLKSAIYNGRHQLDYRQVHGYQKGFFRPFLRISSLPVLAMVLLREMLLFIPHIFIANSRPIVGFRPLNAAFRILMVMTYSLRAYIERGGGR